LKGAINARGRIFPVGLYVPLDQNDHIWQDNTRGDGRISRHCSRKRMPQCKKT